jgi:hypothetical protein
MATDIHGKGLVVLWAGEIYACLNLVKTSAENEKLHQPRPWSFGSD